jgi:serine protease Do
MDRCIVRVLSVYALILLYASPAAALNSRTEQSIRAATFEFLSQSTDPARESLVGSAFSVGSNEFVTTAHLLAASIGSHFDRPVLVDQHGIAYRISIVLRYSDSHDYVTFSLQQPPTVAPLLPPDGPPELSRLYFAGWRADDRVLISAGTIGLSTPDEHSHELNWLRFSGSLWNSSGGGPLLDNTGRVIGIVQARAREAGDNYAVPIEVVHHESTTSADINALEMLRALMPSVTKVEPLRAEIPLPLSFDEFSAKLQRLRVDYIERMVRPLLESTRHNFILDGEGAPEACQLLNGQSCQCKAHRGSSGTLILNDTAEESLLLRIRQGEDVSQKIAGVVVVRSASQNSQSLASPADLQPYVDYHDRTWSMRVRPVKHSDSIEVSLTRRLSEGYVVLTRTAPTSLTYAATLQTQFIANLIYYGCEDLPAEGVARVAER